LLYDDIKPVAVGAAGKHSPEYLAEKAKDSHQKPEEIPGNLVREKMIAQDHA